MRILFRGKAKFDGYGYKDGDWFLGNLIEEIRPDYTDYYINPKINGRKIAVYIETISQYTGLKDCNGNDVFEGDIIQDQDDATLGMIYWDKEEAAFKIATSHEIISADDIVSYQVVGNIWDNKDLFKKIKDKD